MKGRLLIVILMGIFINSFTTSFGGEIKDVVEEWKGPRPYWEHPDYLYRYPYYYPHPYYPYPPPPYQRYEDSRRSPYEGLEVKQAGRLSIVVQPPDARVLVDGYQLSRRDDMTYEIGLLTGLHTVEASKEGYIPYSLTVMVEAGRVLPVVIELKKSK